MLLPEAVVDSGRAVASLRSAQEVSAVALPATLFWRKGREALHNLVQGPSALLSLSCSGVSAASGKAIRTRSGDGHHPASLLRSGGLARLVDAAASREPEAHLHRSYPGLVGAARREAEARLGFDFAALQRFWQGGGRTVALEDGPERAACELLLGDLPEQRCRAQRRRANGSGWGRGSAKAQGREGVGRGGRFRNSPQLDPGRYYNFGTDWRPELVSVERVEAPGQLRGCQSYLERVQRSLRNQGCNFHGGVHARWLFHGSPAIDSIVEAEQVASWQSLNGRTTEGVGHDRGMRAPSMGSESLQMCGASPSGSDCPCCVPRFVFTFAGTRC